MIYPAIKRPLLAVLKAPTAPPEPPAGSPESVRVFRAAPNFLRYRIAVFLAGHVFGLAVEVAAMAGFLLEPGSEEGGVILVLVLLALTLASLLVSYFLIRLDYDMRYYIVTDRSLRIREGAMVIREATFTYANIQNLVVHQGPLERFLGISNLVVQTAGGATPSPKGHETHVRLVHQGVFRGVDNAGEIRDMIQQLMRRYRDAGLGDPEDRPAAGAPGRPLAPSALTRLGEIRDELALWRRSVEGRA